MASTAIVAAPQALLGCATCFGKSDSDLARGMNWGIFSLLVMVVFVLGSVAAFFAYLAKRAATISRTAGAECTSIAETSKQI
jgi:heme/copper-type cytochrome/quinol oxidase subunit 2